MYKNKLQPLINNYKREIEKTHLKDERYKWELLKKYKGLPNLKADNFLDEVKQIDYSNLPYAMSKAVIKQLLLKEPEKIRFLFKNLFNESIDLNTRVKAFNEETLKIHRGLGETLSHHQDERTISVYLTFYNPEKYTFYKYSYYKELCDLLNIEQAKINERYAHYLELIHQIISEYIENDTELIELVKSFIPDYYDGSNHLLVAQDILYQMFNKFEPINYWMYAPGENASKWDEFYEKGIMGLGWDDLGDLNAYSTKKSIKIKLQELANTTSAKTNNTAANYEFLKVMKPGDIIIVKKGLHELLGYGEVTSELFFDDERASYKNYRNVDWILKGNWKLDGNLALKTLTNITKYKEKGNENENYYDKLLAIMNGGKVENKNVIEINNTAPTNKILYGPPGTGKTFYLKDQLFEKYTVAQGSITRSQYLENFVTDFTWWQIITIAVLDLKLAKTNDLLNHELIIAKSKLSSSKNIRPILWSSLQTHTVLECKNVKVQQRIEPLIFNKNDNSKWSIVDTQLKELYPEALEHLEKIKKYKANDDITIKNYDFVTFHQSFAYEDFIEGIKPISPEEGEESKDLGYAIEDGVFKKLCLRAKNDPNNRYAIFIDEINRGNVSAIFGELITLIEIDKRKDAKNEISIKLPYSKTAFSVPSNIDIYGTMNTADRSVEALDTALRRRFEFKEMMPDYTVINEEEIEEIKLSEVLKTINERIELLIDRDHTIGHSYFVNVTSPEKLANAFNNKIVPLLQEYFYGDYGKIGLVLGKGFVEIKKNDTIHFANFKYDNANDFKIASYELKHIDEDTVIDAVLELLGKK
ncbi:AAA family ATPase [Polaribacter sp. Z014]|uniref:AAA family ATPase n=1 Tax=Polaribacter sp. Z014 TaxID=2927126 RepID=UPI002021E10E|nr:AAA family ATPase [Polaribacter sp. Z014]MCL7763175.1 AAA family ATPase [Polaribacter sp. Z014]